MSKGPKPKSVEERFHQKYAIENWKHLHDNN